MKLQRRILLITYHFPPSAASGSFRMLGLARHLPTFGWQPLVVAPPMLPWEPIDPRLVEDVPREVIVEPVRYPSGAPKIFRVLAQSAIWLPRAWSACKRVIAEHRPEVILTSGPPHCVHALGHYLKRRSGLPWVADFRDPWISDGTRKTLSWKQRWALRWERRVFENADLVLANAPNARAMFQQTYPFQGSKIVTLTNGFDPRGAPKDFANASDSEIRLLHAGEIYAGRNPTPLFEALASLNAEVPRYRLHLLGRCESKETAALARERGWADQIVFEGQRDYQETLDAMAQADLLVLFDSPGRRIGVPAKLYEYLGASRPILALAEQDGDTAAILRQSGVLHRIAAPTDGAQIRRAVRELADAMQTGNPITDPGRLQRFTRENLAGSLARQLDRLSGQPNVTSMRLPLESSARCEVLQEVKR